MLLKQLVTKQSPGVVVVSYSDLSATNQTGLYHHHHNNTESTILCTKCMSTTTCVIVTDWLNTVLYNVLHTLNNV